MEIFLDMGTEFHMVMVPWSVVDMGSDMGLGLGTLLDLGTRMGMGLRTRLLSMGTRLQTRKTLLRRLPTRRSPSCRTAPRMVAQHPSRLCQWPPRQHPSRL